MTRSIIWFKTDLRLHDNETLVKAIEQSDEVIPVYCIDDSQFTLGEFGFQKTGNFRAKFLFEAIADLDEQLRAIGSGLLVVKGKPEVVIPKIAKEYYVQKVFAKKEIADEEKIIEEIIEKELWKLKCTLEVYSTSTLYHAEDLPFSIKDIPDVFTAFRKRIEKESTIRIPFSVPSSIKSPNIPPIQLPTLKELGLSEVVIDARCLVPFIGGETKALERLQYYFFESNAIANYKNTRNEMVGANYSTKFSPWLALGCISPRYIYAELKTYEKTVLANDSTYWLEFELLWRDYFRFMFKKYHHKFFLQYGIQHKSDDLHSHQPELFNKWKNGTMGIDFIDANMIELNQTGFMSNRGRQNVASYLCNDLKLDWRYGAAYFEQQLIDYDVSSNWGNWAYIAGVGNDPRKDRYFNTEKQAHDYDAKKEFRNLWLPKSS